MEIALLTGTPIATCQTSNDTAGFAEPLAWIVDHAPGPRQVVSIEGTRSYGVGLASAVAAAGMLVVECEHAQRKSRRGKGKSDPIDAHLAVLTALRLDADRLPVPRTDGDRGGAADPAGCSPGPHRDQYRAGQPPPCAAAQR